MSNFTSRTSMYSRDYDVEAPTIVTNNTSADNSLPKGLPPGRHNDFSPRSSIQRDVAPRDVAPTIGFHSPEAGLPGYRMSSVSPRVSSGNIGILEDGVPRYRLSNSATRISNSANVITSEGMSAYRLNDSNLGTSNDGTGILHEGLHAYRQSNISPRTSSGGDRNGISYDSLPGYSVSSSVTRMIDVGIPEEGLLANGVSNSNTLSFNSGNDIPNEGLLAFHHSNTGPRASNVANDIPHESLPKYSVSSYGTQMINVGIRDEGLPANRLSNFNALPSNSGNGIPKESLSTYRQSISGPHTSNVAIGIPDESHSGTRTSNVGIVIPDKGLPAYHLSTTPLPSNSSLPFANNDMGIPTGEIRATHLSTSGLVIDGVGIQEERIPAYHLNNSNDRIPTERLVAQHSDNSNNLPTIIEKSLTSKKTSTFGHDNIVNDMFVGFTPSIGVASGSNTFTSESSKGNRTFLQDAPPIENVRKMNGISPLEVLGVGNVGLPPLMLSTKQVGQWVPCTDANCLAHQCCIKVVCVCDTGHSQPVVVSHLNSIEQAPSSQRYNQQLLTSIQKDRQGHRRDSDPFPLRSSELLPTRSSELSPVRSSELLPIRFKESLPVRSNRTSSTRFGDPASTSSDRDKQKLRPITRGQVNFFCKFSSGYCGS